MRNAEISRKTLETDVRIALCVDGAGNAAADTGCGFLDHMLTLLAFHARFDLDVSCRGDLRVDAHHTTEDVAIALGQALFSALSDKRGITRYGQSLLPMDEALVLCALDFSGRGGAYVELPIAAQKVGDFDTELAEEFFTAFAREARLTLHIRLLHGGNSHHVIEAAFKALARALAQATALDPRMNGQTASTKGAL